uniref:Coiled-coil domain-containing protein 24 n=1 Tax=Macrostomum lignano TaxID=282301 RepID=A0A1I8J2D3_9PLAT
MLSPRSYEAPSSLWEIVREHAAPSEHHELKHLIGADLIDQTLELRREIGLLLELSMDLQDDEDSHEMRARLAQEIVFFLEAIREQQRTTDLRKYDVNQEVVDYAYESSSSRPSTGNSRLSLGEIRVTPCSSARSGSRRTARSVEAPTAEDVAGMRDQLTYMRCDEVRRRLRSHLQEEIDQLKQDLEQLQESLQTQQQPGFTARSDTHHGHRPPSSLQRSLSREPTLSDLRSERHKLERALLEACKDEPALREHRPAAAAATGCHSNKAVNETIQRPLAPLMTSTAGSQRPSSAQRLRSMVQQSRQQQQVVPPLKLPD